MDKKIKKYAVFGNPIKHSQSPWIHKLFSEQTNIEYKYKKICPPEKKFQSFFKNFFFEEYGEGANITLPFKKEAYNLCNRVTKRAKIAKAVNVVVKKKEKILIGDNTDGIGLMFDLINLKFIKKNYKVLLIGSGGAARGIIFPILNFGCDLVLTNRTIENAEKLASIFSKYKKIQVLPFAKLFKPDFNLIINATSIENKKTILPLNPLLIHKDVFCYDISYKKYDTQFLSWCKKQGSKNCVDGIGMLVSQAAYSFLLWHGFLPKILPVINFVKKNFRNITLS